MEITFPLELSEEESSLLDMHSVLNVVNCINHELIQISEHAKDDKELLALMDDVAKVGDLLRNPEQALALVTDIDSFIAKVEEVLDGTSHELPLGTRIMLSPHRENLNTIYSIIRIRAQEIVARNRSPDTWVDHSISELTNKLVDFLSAVEKNSHGGYRIVQNSADQGVDDYLIEFKITSHTGNTICMPVIFQDVIRDLLANARKYTPRGGHIQGSLHGNAHELRLIIKDNGIGIPSDSIKDVVLFGIRAANVADRVTRGGGFGLTKAYYITRRYKGRMWIDSATKEEGGNGTRIQISIPNP